MDIEDDVDVPLMHRVTAEGEIPDNLTSKQRESIIRQGDKMFLRFTKKIMSVNDNNQYHLFFTNNIHLIKF